MLKLLGTAIFLAILVNLSCGVEQRAVTENPAAGKSHKEGDEDSVSAEEALDLKSPYALKLVREDKKKTCRDTLMSKFQLTWNSVEVWNFTVVLEKYDDVWAKFATGAILEDIESNLQSASPKLSKREAAELATKSIPKDEDDRVDFDIDNPHAIILYVMLDTKTSEARLVYRIEFLILRDGSEVKPTQTTRVVNEAPSRLARAAEGEEEKDLEYYQKLADSKMSQIMMIMDANSGEIVHKQDSIVSYLMTGDGGNINVGRYYYGDWEWAGRKLDVQGFAGSPTCTLQNPLAASYSAGGSWIPTSQCFSGGPFQEACDPPSPNVDATPTTYSQVHDGLYFATRFQEMLQELYGDTTLQTCCGQVRVCVHYGAWDNAFFSNSGNCETYYGDGFSLFTGLASKTVVAHELGHALIQCTSGLQYWSQSGGMNEAFADISGITFKAFLNGYHDDWSIGNEIMKNLAWGDALRYMDNPPKDGKSIDCSHDYTGQGPHYASGVYNKAFYNLVSMERWCFRTAYEIFLHATKWYWNAFTGYDDGLCGLIQSAYVLGYNAEDVRDAFAKVGVYCKCPPGWLPRFEFPHGPSNWQDRRTSCYKIVRDVASWAEARVFCRTMKSELMNIKDKSEASWVYNWLTWLNNVNKHHLLEKAEYWIAGLDMSSEAQWKWINQPVTWTHWQATEPNNYLGYQNCMAIRQLQAVSGNPSWSWVDDDCYQKKFFICEKSCCGKACDKNC